MRITNIKNKNIAIKMITSALLLTSLSGCNTSPIDKPIVYTEDEAFTIVFPSYDEEIDIMNDNFRNYLDNYSKGCSSLVQGLGDVYQSKIVKLEWDYEGDSASYEVQIGTKEDLSNAVSYSTTSKYLTLKYLNVNQTYYWRVIIGDKCSKLSSFKIIDGIRTLDIDGVSNARDIGGKITLSGKKIKQGMVFRSASFDDISDEEIEEAKNNLGIKTDFDLRNPETSISPLGKDVKVIRTPFPYWYGGTTGIDTVTGSLLIRQAFDVFKDINNYPIAFHCAIGQDRTGTLAILLEGLLGLDETSICIDYEMSSFSSVAGDAKNNAGKIIKIEDKWTYQVNPTLNYLKRYGGNNLSEAICNYLYIECGVEEETMNSIIDILLED